MTSQSLDQTLSEAQGASVVTRDGLALTLRPVSPADARAVQEFFDGLAPDDMRFRFLSGMKHLSADQLAAMVDIDHRHREHLLAYEGGSSRPVASLMIAADEHMEVAEVAIAVDPAYKDRGIGWALLRHATQLARERGIRRLQSIESRENHKAIEVERTLGFTARDYGDATLVLLEAELR